METYLDIEGFEWDEGNKNKNWHKHSVAWWECEEVFFNHPLYLVPDIQHSQDEERIFAFGHTNAVRLLTIVFTIRKKYIRIISARDMNRKERNLYHEENSSF